LAAEEQIRRLIERLAYQANRTAKSPSPEAVHDLRVAIRRAEQALITFKPLLLRKPVKRIRRQLKAVLSTAGGVRDCDIALAILLKIKLPEADELRRVIRVRRKTAEKGLLARLKRLSLRRRISNWFADLKLHETQAGSATGTPPVAASVLPRLAQRFLEAGEAAASHNSSEKLHDFRIRAKKLRYTLELFVPVYGPPVEEWIGKIKSVQSILGAMNDYRSVLALAAEFGCGKKLKTSLKRKERRKIREFREVWAGQFPGSIAVEWKRIVRAGRQAPRIARKPMASEAPRVERAVRA
jgi:CHAD domain-containing protein